MPDASWDPWRRVQLVAPLRRRRPRRLGERYKRPANGRALGVGQAYCAMNRSLIAAALSSTKASADCSPVATMRGRVAQAKDTRRSIADAVTSWASKMQLRVIGLPWSRIQGRVPVAAFPRSSQCPGATLRCRLASWEAQDIPLPVRRRRRQESTRIAGTTRNPVSAGIPTRGSGRHSVVHGCRPFQGT